MSERAVVLFSGGLDSTTLLYSLRAEGFEVLPLVVNYGQKHVQEMRSASRIAEALSVPLTRALLNAALQPIFAGAESSQVGSRVEVPKGHYESESMKLTIVPNRNMLLIAVAGAFAVSRKANVVAYAAHAGDHAIYPDCRQEFVESCARTLHIATDVELLAPFAGISKTEIVRRGAKLQVPFEFTYSCYEGGLAHCGLCGTCFERREAFRDAGVPDPTEYAPIALKEI